ncbi:MAG: hypothetical protein R3C27_14455 [Hyphomonadaceae bacterium]
MNQAASSSKQVNLSGQNDEARPEDIKEAVLTILQTHDLPAHENAVEHVVETVTCARWCAAERLERPKLPNRVATKLRNAMTTGLEIAQARELASPTELEVLRRLRRLAESDSLRPRSTPGPQIRPWLWYWCAEFLDAWRRLTTRPAGVWMTDSDAPSPALAFLVDCCRLVDPTVNTSAILNAKKKNPDPNSPLHGASRRRNSWSSNPQRTLFGQIWTERVGAKTSQT